MNNVKCLGRVYVAGPYTARTDEEISANVERAVEVSKALLRRGYMPFCPHSMTHGWDNDGLEYDDFLRLGIHWLAACDALYYIGPSPGADRELLVAEALGLPIFRGLDEVRPCASQPGS